jgi:DNA-binding MarR family transcriptional regulator
MMVRMSLPEPPPSTGTEPRPGGAARADAIAELSMLTLPLMWSLRQEAMRIFEPLGLRPTRVLVLELVARGVDRPGTLAEMLDTVPPAVTAMLNELEAKGMLERETDPDDRRRTRLHLGPNGEEFLAQAREQWGAASVTRLSRLSDDDLIALLQAFRSLLNDESDESDAHGGGRDGARS